MTQPHCVMAVLFILFKLNANYVSVFAIELEKLSAIDKIRVLCQTSIISIVTNDKNELYMLKHCQWVNKFSDDPQLQSVSIFFKFVHPYLLLYLLCYL